MIGRAIDNLVSIISPARAVRRVHARSVYNQLSRSYDAAKRDRLSGSKRNQNQSADLAMQKADIVRAEARDLVRNNAYARGVTAARKRNIVGQGIRPQAAIVDSQGNAVEAQNERIEKVWKRWARQCDAGGRLTFNEMQRLILQEVDEAGEVLVHFVDVSDERGRVLPLALELIEADRLAEDTFQLFGRKNLNPETGNEIRRGVEINKAGRAVAYWLYPSNPNDVSGATVTPVRHSAENFLHLYKVERVGQTRGMSIFAPVLRWLKSLGYYTENELQASAVASCFTVAIKTLDGAASGGLVPLDGEDASDDDGNTLEHIQPALVARLMPGESVETINPGRPNSDAGPWIDLMMRSIGVGTELSYERLTRDYSKTNYSSNRASDLEDRRAFRPDQDWLIDHFCVPVWERFIAAAVNAGLEGFPSATELLGEYERFTDASWQPPGWEWVDPEKEAKGSILSLEANLTTLQEELGNRGRDLNETLTQRSREKKMIDEYGLTPPPKPGAPLPANQPAAKAEDDDPEDTEEDDADETAEVETAAA